ncbi:Trehalose import ATP-binding protein SugC [Novipirellula galeiformis]|uniref:Trehalose import ATP-binding protein SugC n=1 Tax=Novipirellula galeiformis TaxID=2528004 RepID=A0A5C6CPD3_9BACT|nr:ABC transporter ATP-binding protein [Novipirellula galeiformis]TWU24916.1 Trehalose import ATP-binding protein SugC [Novipirellula galeiformis]
MLAVQLVDIEKRYHDRDVLQSICLHVEAGEYMVLLGESGCGKTTMLRTIAGLESADGGRVEFGGVDVSRIAARKRDVSMLFQRDALYPHMTLRQTMAFPMKGLVSDSETQQRIERAAKLLGLDAMLDRHPEHFSGGELRRGGLAKMVVRQASIRLLDEPLSALDGPVRHQFQQDLQRWHREIPGTTIHVTHDGDEAMRMADRVAVMHQGQIVQVGTPEEIFHHPCCLSVAKSIGSPPINVLGGELRQGELRVHASDDPIELNPAVGPRHDGHVFVAIRPEGFGIVASSGANDAIASTTSAIRFSGVCRSSLVYGGQCHASFETQNEILDATLPADCGVQRGDPVTIAAMLADVHLFDGEGKRIEVAR